MSSTSTSTLMRASNEWATRPADERFTSLSDLHRYVMGRRERAAVRTIPNEALQIVDTERGLGITRGRATALLNNWSFGQIASRVGAPAGYLETLPAKLAAECLNTGMAAKSDLTQPSILLEKDGDGPMRVRAVTSDRYARIWDSEITSRLIRLQDSVGFQPAPAAFDGSRGLYAGDRSMFAFLVDNDRRIFEQASDGGFSRGFFVWNSEVGASSFGMTTFLYQYVCGNHIVWGASDVTEVRLRHVGENPDRAFAALGVAVSKYVNSSSDSDEQRLVTLQGTLLGSTRDEVLDTLFGLRLPTSQAVLKSGVTVAEERVDRYGDPRTAYAVMCGLTEFSQTESNADARTAIDRAAGLLAERVAPVSASRSIIRL